jgi:hypothetical protein
MHYLSQHVKLIYSYIFIEQITIAIELYERTDFSLHENQLDGD